MTDAMWVKTQAKRLHAAGYRGVSNAFRIVARVDQDIREFVERDRAKMRKQHGHKGWSQYNFLLKMPQERADDWFRRCISEDKQTVSSYVYKAMKNL